MASLFRIGLLTGFALLTVGCPSSSGPGAGTGGGSIIANILGGTSGGTGGPGAGDPVAAPPSSEMSQDPSGGEGPDGSAAAADTTEATPPTVAGVPSGPVPVTGCTLYSWDVIAVEDTNNSLVKIKGYLRCDDDFVTDPHEVTIASSSGTTQKTVTSGIGCFFTTLPFRHGDTLSLRIFIDTSEEIAVSSSGEVTPCVDVRFIESSNVDMMQLAEPLPSPGSLPPAIKILRPEIKMPATSEMAGKAIAPLLKK